MKRSSAILAILLLGGCMAPPPGLPGPPPPPPPGMPAAATYRAVGTEPFWGLSIDDREIVFTAPDAQPVSQPRPPVIVGFAGEIYQTPRIRVNIVHAQCSDGMSDRTYPDKVQVDVDDRRFDGCGGEAVAPMSLSGTNWRVIAIGGRDVPPQRQFSMRFEAAQVSARFGCNSIGGDYRVTGNVLAVEHLLGTQMACQDMSFEQQGSAIMRAPMTISWSGADRLTLENAIGRIVLDRSY